MRLLLLTLNLTLLIFPVFAKQQSPKMNNHVVLISHVNIVDVANNDIKNNQHVLIVGDKIQQISSVKPVLSANANAKIVDGRGKYLMAGLIDMHVHVFQPAELYQLITHGVTTARIMYGLPETLEYREDIKQGVLIGPDLIVASPVINQPSPYASSTFHRFVDSPEQASKLVTKYAKQGFDLIKIYDGLQPEIFSAIVQTAKEHDLPIAGHPSFYLSIDEFIAEKPQSIEHIEMLYQASLDYSKDASLLDKLAKKLAVHKIPVTTTLVVYDNLAKMAVEKQHFIDSLPINYIHPLLKILEQDNVDFITTVEKPQQWRDKADYLGHIAKVLNENNVPLVIGSDGGAGYTINGKSTIDEMVLLASYGLPINDILRAATITPALALKREQQIGIVAAGFTANLILLASDPRKDLSVLRNPVAVIKSGRVFNQAALAKLDNKAQQHMNWLSTALMYLWAAY